MNATHTPTLLDVHVLVWCNVNYFDHIRESLQCRSACHGLIHSQHDSKAAPLGHAWEHADVYSTDRVSWDVRLISLSVCSLGYMRVGLHTHEHYLVISNTEVTSVDTELIRRNSENFIKLFPQWSSQRPRTKELGKRPKITTKTFLILWLWTLTCNLLPWSVTLTFELHIDRVTKDKQHAKYLGQGHEFQSLER